MTRVVPPKEGSGDSVSSGLAEYLVFFSMISSTVVVAWTRLIHHQKPAGQGEEVLEI